MTAEPTTADLWAPLTEARWREISEGTGAQLRFAAARFGGASATAAARMAGYAGDSAQLRRAGYAAVRSSVQFRTFLNSPPSTRPVTRKSRRGKSTPKLQSSYDLRMPMFR